MLKEAGEIASTVGEAVNEDTGPRGLVKQQPAAEGKAERQTTHR